MVEGFNQGLGRPVKKQSRSGLVDAPEKPINGASNVLLIVIVGQSGLQQAVQSQNIQGVLHVVAVGEDRPRQDLGTIRGQSIRFVVEHKILSIMLQHQIHEADEHAFELQWLQRDTCLALKDVLANERIYSIRAKKIRVSLFVDANEKQIRTAKKIGADIVELHTGEFCHALKKKREDEFEKIKTCAALCEELGLECHAGHGLNYETAKIIAQIPQIIELNIGHFIIGEAIFEGLGSVIKKMKKAISQTIPKHEK